MLTTVHVPIFTSVQLSQIPPNPFRKHKFSQILSFRRIYCVSFMTRVDHAHSWALAYSPHNVCVDPCHKIMLGNYGDRRLYVFGCSFQINFQPLFIFFHKLKPIVKFAKNSLGQKWVCLRYAGLRNNYSVEPGRAVTGS